jgi:hypothetical protein
MRAHMCAMCRQQSDARDRRDYLRFCWRGGGSETRQFHYQHHRAANERVALMRIECCTESSCMKNCARVRFCTKTAAGEQASVIWRISNVPKVSLHAGRADLTHLRVLTTSKIISFSSRRERKVGCLIAGESAQQLQSHL